MLRHAPRRPASSGSSRSHMRAHTCHYTTKHSSTSPTNSPQIVSVPLTPQAIKTAFTYDIWVLGNNNPPYGSYRSGARFMPISRRNIPGVVRYDAGIFGFSREKYVRESLYIPDVYGLVSELNYKVAGFGFIYPNFDSNELVKNKSWQVVLCADNMHVAGDTLNGLLFAARQDEIRVKTPGYNKSAGELLTKFGFHRQEAAPLSMEVDQPVGGNKVYGFGGPMSKK